MKVLSTLKKNFLRVKKPRQTAIEKLVTQVGRFSDLMQPQDVLIHHIPKFQNQRKWAYLQKLCGEIKSAMQEIRRLSHKRRHMSWLRDFLFTSMKNRKRYLHIKAALQNKIKAAHEMCNKLRLTTLAYMEEIEALYPTGAVTLKEYAFFSRCLPEGPMRQFYQGLLQVHCYKLSQSQTHRIKAQGYFNDMLQAGSDPHWDKEKQYSLGLFYEFNCARYLQQQTSGVKQSMPEQKAVGLYEALAKKHYLPAVHRYALCFPGHHLVFQKYQHCPLHTSFAYAGKQGYLPAQVIFGEYFTKYLGIQVVDILSGRKQSQESLLTGIFFPVAKQQKIFQDLLDAIFMHQHQHAQDIADNLMEKYHSILALQKKTTGEDLMRLQQAAQLLEPWCQAYLNRQQQEDPYTTAPENAVPELTLLEAINQDLPHIRPEGVHPKYARSRLSQMVQRLSAKFLPSDQPTGMPVAACECPNTGHSP